MIYTGQSVSPWSEMGKVLEQGTKFKGLRTTLD